jgi:hypothetical protein
MLGRPVAAPARSGTPLYLGLARVTAGFAVVAFVSAFALTALEGSEDDGGELAAGADLRETSLNADDAAAGDASKEALYEAPTTPVTPEIAPATTGGASGSAVETPAAPDSGANRSSADPPEASGQLPPPQAATDSADGSPVDLDTTSLAAQDTGDDDSGTVLALGVIAVLALTLLAGLEVNRRLRRA